MYILVYKNFVRDDNTLNVCKETSTYMTMFIYLYIYI